MTAPRTLFRLGRVAKKQRDLIMRALNMGAPGALDALVVIAGQFQAVGRWSLDEWAALTPAERFACSQAHEEAEARSARRLAALVGLASRRAGQAEEFAAEFDGGALREEAAVDGALEEFARVAESVPRGGA